MENGKIELPRDLIIPTKLYLNKNIDAEYKFLYAYISYRASTRGYIWYQNDTLAEHLNKNISSIKRGLKALADAKWLKIENRVKKGQLYHQDLRRAIWIYSDYLVALDKGGYGVARPLAFTTWKKRFIAALLDSSKIPLILYFFPTAQKLGDLGAHYDANSKRLYAYVLNTHKKYETRKLDGKESEKIYKELYEFYCAQHQEQNIEKDKFEMIDNFNDFQYFIRSSYIDKKIALVNEKYVTVNALGMLMKYDENENMLQLDTDLAIWTWQWLFTNQDQIIKGK